MSDEIPLNTDEKYYGKVVTPIKRRRTRGEMYEDEFSYTKVYMEDGMEDELPDDAEVVFEDGKLFYKYPGKVPVMVDEDGAHRHMDTRVSDAEEQAFFVLSILASAGNVGSWGK